MKVLSLSLVLASVGSLASAATLPAATVGAEIVVFPTYGIGAIYTPASLSGPQVVVDYTSLAASAATKLNLAGWGGSASSAQSSAGFFSAQPYSSVTYALEVTSQNDTMVAVDFSGFISAHIKNSAFASSKFSVSDSHGNPILFYFLCFGGCVASSIPNGPTYQYITTGTSAANTISMVGQIPTNEVLTISLATDVNTYGGTAGNAAVALNKVKIDPSVVNPGQYKIIRGACSIAARGGRT